MLMEADLPDMSIMKCRACRRRILYGPVYGACSGLRTASVRTYTWVQVYRSLGTRETIEF